MSFNGQERHRCRLLPVKNKPGTSGANREQRWCIVGMDACCGCGSDCGCGCGCGSIARSATPHEAVRTHPAPPDIAAAMLEPTKRRGGVAPRRWCCEGTFRPPALVLAARPLLLGSWPPLSPQPPSRREESENEAERLRPGHNNMILCNVGQRGDS